MKTLIFWILGLAVFVGALGFFATDFPGAAAKKAAPGSEDADLTDRLRIHVESLAFDIGARDNRGALDSAADHIGRHLRRAGLEVTERDMGGARAGTRVVVGEVGSRKEGREILVLSAHYDSNSRSPGADSNASGCAVLMEVALQVAGSGMERTLRFVFFPDGARQGAGRESSAARYAKACKEAGEKIVGVINLDSVGNFSSAATQSYPFPLGLRYPARADFLGVVGGFGSHDLTSKTVEYLRGQPGLSIEGVLLPEFLPGTGFSSHAAFWDAGYAAVTITDTGSWRGTAWGTPADTHDRLDYPAMSRLVTALTRAVGMLSRKAMLT